MLAWGEVLSARLAAKAARSRECELQEEQEPESLSEDQRPSTGAGGLEWTVVDAGWVLVGGVGAEGETSVSMRRLMSLMVLRRLTSSMMSLTRLKTLPWVSQVCDRLMLLERVCACSCDKPP